MTKSDSILTINSISNINSDMLNKFMKDGFAYVKIPDASLEKGFLKLQEVALRFFDQPKEIKERDKLNPETFQGYSDKRKNGRKKELVEQITFSPSKPIGLFTECEIELNTIHEIYYFKIIKPLFKIIFNKILGDQNFSKENINSLIAEATDEIFFIMSVLFYPYSKEPTDKDFGLFGHIVQPEHVDEGLFTILWVAQEGLQVWLENDADSGKSQPQENGKWYDIGPKPGHVIVNIGKALSLILGGKCNAANHRVILPREDRLSIGVFYNPPITYKLRDLIVNKELFGGSYEKYIKDYFSKPSN